MAEQTEPVVRKVAFKIINLGMDTKQVVGRFEAERQALALMDHPNIAKVLDAGVPVPKVIDFGIAKATNQRLTEKRLFTNYAEAGPLVVVPGVTSPHTNPIAGGQRFFRLARSAKQ